MPLFKHRGHSDPEGAGSAAGSAVSGPKGRHLHSDLDDEACVANFKALNDFPESAYFSPEWLGPTESMPSTLIGLRLDETDPAKVLYLSIWDRGGYQEGVGYQEMALIPPVFDPNVPIALTGQWKMRDPSLKSIGYTNDFPVR